ncbi:MAG: DUF1614 domain-containing protein [Candidatus Aenigmatarchaeota archaeon]
MRPSKHVMLPLAMMFFIFLLIVLLVLSIVVTSVFRALGFSPITTIGIFFFSLLGSTVNIPVYTKEMKQPIRMPRPGTMLSFLYRGMGREYTITEVTVAVNLGGAVIPMLVSFYLIFTNPGLWMQFLVGIFVVTAVSYRFSRILPGVGISLPLFIPPITAVVIAIVLPGGPNTIIEFVSGVSGVLLGADVLNLKDFEKLRSKTMSIGGAGTFDGIFLTGIVSVLLAALV